MVSNSSYFVYPENLDERNTPRIVFSVPAKTSFHFPIPQNLSFSDGMDFGTFDNDIITSALTDGFNKIFDTTSSQDFSAEGLGNILNKASELGGDALKYLGDLSKSDEGTTLAKMISAKYIDQIEGSSRFAPALANSASIAFNPNTTLHFKSPKIRTFTFSFKMVANNSSQAQDITNMLGLFEKYMYPTTQGDFFLTYPEKFNISFYNTNNSTIENSHIPKIEECFLIDMKRTFNESSNIFHGDGSPMDSTLVMTFRETKIKTLKENNSKIKGLLEAVRKERADSAKFASRTINLESLPKPTFTTTTSISKDLTDTKESTLSSISSSVGNFFDNIF